MLNSFQRKAHKLNLGIFLYLHLEIFKNLENCQTVLYEPCEKSNEEKEFAKWAVKSRLKKSLNFVKNHLLQQKINSSVQITSQLSSDWSFCTTAKENRT